ncbi:MAG: hypothetical protein JWN70_6536 [Planctomycetaceae bacterium]|nr:hypothetical protein [Planctomycetaceae bacterium]
MRPKRESADVRFTAENAGNAALARNPKQGLGNHRSIQLSYGSIECNLFRVHALCQRNPGRENRFRLVCGCSLPGNPQVDYCFDTRTRGRVLSESAGGAQAMNEDRCKWMKAIFGS